eukprot:2573641-Amphidinium_carterae.1
MSGTSVGFNGWGNAKSIQERGLLRPARYITQRHLPQLLRMYTTSHTYSSEQSDRQKLGALTVGMGASGYTAFGFCLII